MKKSVSETNGAEDEQASHNRGKVDRRGHGKGEGVGLNRGGFAVRLSATMIDMTMVITVLDGPCWLFG